MNRLKACVYLLAISTVLLPAVGYSKNIWRDCGIGALIFSETKWAAVTSNIIWDLGITASTSTSSSEDQCAGKTASSAHFIYENYAVIEEETAIGNGEHLTTMLNILGCQESAHSQIINTLRNELTKDLQGPNTLQKTKLQKAERYHGHVIDNALASNCAVI